MQRGWITLGFAVVFLTAGCPAYLQAEDAPAPWGGDSDAGLIPQAPPGDSSDAEMGKMKAQASAMDSQGIAPVILHNEQGGDVGVVNPENGVGSLMQGNVFVKVFCRPDEGPSGGTVVLDDRSQKKIGAWHKDPSSGDYVLKLEET